MTTLTLTEVEEAVGYTVAWALREYRDGTYGDAGEWDAESIATAELDGDAGDQIRKQFRGEDRDAARDLWREAVLDLWPLPAEDASADTTKTVRIYLRGLGAFEASTVGTIRALSGRPAGAVSYHQTTDARFDRARENADYVEQCATDALGQPESGWEFLDQHGKRFTRA